MRLLMVAVLVSGCSVAREDFSETLASAYCNRAERCEELDGPLEDCIDGVSVLVELSVDADEVLDRQYDPVQGGICVRHVRSRECDELTDWLDDDECDVTVDEG
ncbi:MAG: hypothetical protein AB8H79_25590 [Myxococcota bacterium]